MFQNISKNTEEVFDDEVDFATQSKKEKIIGILKQNFSVPNIIIYALAFMMSLLGGQNSPVFTSAARVDGGLLHVVHQGLEGCVAAPGGAHLHQAALVVHVHHRLDGQHGAEEGGGAGDAVKHVLRLLLPQMVDQQDGKAQMICQPFQHG